MKYDSYDDDIETAVGANQLNSVEDDINDVLNGDFDDIMDITNEDLETMMDSSSDIEDLDGAEDRDVLLAREIVKSVCGRLEDGEPAAAVSVSLEMIDPDTEMSRLTAQQAIYKPVITLNKRMDFIEASLEFPTAIDVNLRVMLANLDKYGAQLNDVTAASAEIPVCTLLLFPIKSLGTCYMTLSNPAFWALTADGAGKATNVLKVLFRAEDVGFFQTDEIDITEIHAAIQREEEARLNAMEDLAAKEQAKRDYEAKMDDLRRELKD